MTYFYLQTMATWKNHFIFNVTASYFIGLSFADIIATSLLYNINDKLDSAISFKKIKYKNQYIKAHRKIFHNLSLWLIIFIFLCFLKPIKIDKYYFHFYSLALGPILHLVLDFFTPYGIYIFNKRKSFKLYKTGTPQEDLIILIICSILFILAYKYKITLFYLFKIISNNILNLHFFN